MNGYYCTLPRNLSHRCHIIFIIIIIIIIVVIIITIIIVIIVVIIKTLCQLIDVRKFNFSKQLMMTMHFVMEEKAIHLL